MSQAKRPSWAIEQGRYREGIGYGKRKPYADIMPIRRHRNKLGIVVRFRVKRWRDIS